MEKKIYDRFKAWQACPWALIVAETDDIITGCIQPASGSDVSPCLAALHCEMCRREYAIRLLNDQHRKPHPMALLSARD